MNPKIQTQPADPPPALAPNLYRLSYSFMAADGHLRRARTVWPGPSRLAALEDFTRRNAHVKIIQVVAT